LTPIVTIKKIQTDQLPQGHREGGPKRRDTEDTENARDARDAKLCAGRDGVLV
jgi:hypothetical protein